MVRTVKNRAASAHSAVGVEPRTSGSARLKGLSPLRKQQLVTESFERKVEIMETMLKRPWKEGDWWPSTLGELREWKDQESGLIEWSDQHIDAPTGPNRGLRVRFDAAKDKLYKRSPLGRLEMALEEIRVLKAERKGLSAQNLMLMAEIQSLSDQLSRSNSVTQSSSIRLHKAE